MPSTRLPSSSYLFSIRLPFSSSQYGRIEAVKVSSSILISALGSYSISVQDTINSEDASAVNPEFMDTTQVTV